MTRNALQQAKSTVKFLREIQGLSLRAGTEHLFRDSYLRDEPKALQLWRSIGRVHIQSFEDLITNPEKAAKEIYLNCNFYTRKVLDPMTAAEQTASDAHAKLRAEYGDLIREQAVTLVMDMERKHPDTKMQKIDLALQVVTTDALYLNALEEIRAMKEIMGLA